MYTVHVWYIQICGNSHFCSPKNQKNTHCWWCGRFCVPKKIYMYICMFDWIKVINKVLCPGEKCTYLYVYRCILDLCLEILGRLAKSQLVLKRWDTDIGCIHENVLPTRLAQNSSEISKLLQQSVQVKIQLTVKNSTGNQIESTQICWRQKPTTKDWNGLNSKKMNHWNRHQLNQHKSSEIIKMGQQINLTPEQYQPCPDPFTPAKTLHTHFAVIGVFCWLVGLIVEWIQPQL